MHSAGDMTGPDTGMCGTGHNSLADPPRRRFLAWSALAVAAGMFDFPRLASASQSGRCTAVPLDAVRLAPSIFLDALEVNRRYLMELSADRLLHNFREYAGLPPKAPAYGGWEADTIAGHTLGHYLSALSKLHAQTGDAAARARADYIVAELARCQAAGGDGYVGGLTRRDAGGKLESGRKVFEELHTGRIEAARFRLNGSWSPLYTVHKMLAGLLDAQRHCGSEKALQVALGMGEYLERCLAPLDAARMQEVMRCEFGGINESFAEMHVRTGDARWLRLARRFHDHTLLDPLAAAHDDLPHRHANATIPQLVGVARVYETAGDAADAAAARYFWETVTAHYSYAIGGDGDREYFQQPDTVAEYLTEQTCEHCASYNMLKLTRHVYQWAPQARYFDYYERTLHNHIMAQQHPRSGMFTYMTPTISGAAREYSTPDDSFWCCVGTGMESHAQFGDSIYWHDADTLYVNLYIPSTLDWRERGLQLEQRGGMPLQGNVSIVLRQVGAAAPRRLALRIPGWAGGEWSLRCNGQRVHPRMVDGYAVVERRWRSGDTIELALPMGLRLESAPGDRQTVAVLRGPLVLAADLGPADRPYDQPSPALVADGAPLGSFRAEAATAQYVTDATRPSGLRFTPFYSQYDRRSAMYFKRMDDAGWQRELARRAELQAADRRLAKTSVDMIGFGDEASEKVHGLSSAVSFAGAYRRQACRDVRGTGYIAFAMANDPGTPLSLRLRCWGSDTGRFRILVDGQLAAEVLHKTADTPAFVDRDYPLPPKLTIGKVLHIRIEPEHGDTAGPWFGGWLIRTGSLPADTAA